ncbi:MAG: ABC transporter ATP-binding protein [Ardenticatenales bacterium]|nr:ABC transporter ATP-binding protein [Ardenticatenales bacterium]
MPAIQFQAVTKKFTLHHDEPRSLQERFLRTLSSKPQKRPPTESYYALKDVSFVIERGQTFGLIGTNGSGKSTALKLMAGIFPPTHGIVRTDGRLSALLELGAGMHPELTGRENIFLNGTILGLSNSEMHALYPSIVDFAELERFIDMPVKHYSSGMYMRLGFSVAIHSRPDILLVDEVLAVGDQAFQTKCLERLYQMRRRGTTIVFVSHSAALVEELCEQIVWLHNGEMRGYGDSKAVTNDYLRFLHQQELPTDAPPPPAVPPLTEAAESVGVDGLLEAAGQADIVGEGNGQPNGDRSFRSGDHQAEILGVRMIDGEGRPRQSFLTGDDITFEIYYRAHVPIEEPSSAWRSTISVAPIYAAPIPFRTNSSSLVLRGMGSSATRCVTNRSSMAPTNCRSPASIVKGCTPTICAGRNGAFGLTRGSEERYGLLRMGEWSHAP